MEPNTRLVIGGPQGTERTVSLAETDITIGRAATNDVVLSDAKASRAHAQLVYSDAQWTLVDLGSANGTRLNGQPVLDRVPLQPGDVIAVGDSTLLFDSGLATSLGPLVIDTPADLEATLADATVPIQLNDTHVARLAIQTPNGTWETPLQQESLLIGRQSDCDVVLNLERFPATMRVSSAAATSFGCATWTAPTAPGWPAGASRSTRCAAAIPFALATPNWSSSRLHPQTT
jgi:hypothetical protein